MTEDPRATAEFRTRRRVPDAGDVVGRHIARVAGIFDAAPIGVSVWSTDGELLHANPVQCDLFRATRPDLIGQRFEEFIEPRAAPTVRQGVQDLWSGDRNHFGARLRCFDAQGAERWLRAELAAVYGPDGRPAYLLAQVFDFSGLRDATDGGPDLLEQAPALVWVTDDRGIPRRGSPAAHRFVGSAPETGDLAQGFFEHTHPDDFDRLGVELRKRVRERLPLDFVARARRADGSWRWMRNEARPYFDDRGTFVGYVGTSVDVSEYEDLRAELEATRSLFRTVTEAGPLAVARLDRRGLLTYANRRWEDVLDDPQSRLAGLNWKDLLAPDEVREIVEQGAASVGTGRAFSYRVATSGVGARADLVVPGVRYWAELRVVPVYDDAGDHDGWVATLTDVSAEIEAGSRADLLARVLDAGTDVLMIAERNGALSYLNNAAGDVLGIEVPALGDGEPPTFLWDVLDDDSFAYYHEQVEPILVEHGIWRGELALRPRHGDPVAVSALFLAHQDERGRITSISVVARDITDLKVAQEQLHELATHDYLTGMPNRVLLYDRIEQALARYRRHGRAAALLFCDLDRFKPVNDAYGHHVGDQVLREVADRVASVVRDTDTAARVGGDEFCVLVEGVDDADQLEAVATRLIEVLSEPIDVDGQVATLGVSIGMVSVDETTADADTLIALADAAMYRAKAAGRGRLVVHRGGDGS